MKPRTTDLAMEPKLIQEKIMPDKLAEMVKEGYYEGMAKFAVDVEIGILAIGGEWHSDAAEILTRGGSLGNNVWGANLYSWKKPHERIVYTSLINLKPVIAHKKIEITDPALRQKMYAIITRLLLANDEILPAE